MWTYPKQFCDLVELLLYAKSHAKYYERFIDELDLKCVLMGPTP